MRDVYGARTAEAFARGGQTAVATERPQVERIDSNAASGRIGDGRELIEESEDSLKRARDLLRGLGFGIPISAMMWLAIWWIVKG